MHELHTQVQYVCITCSVWRGCGGRFVDVWVLKFEYSYICTYICKYICMYVSPVVFVEET